MVTIALLLGAIRRISSAYPTAPQNKVPRWQPTPALLSFTIRSFMYTENNAGESTEPCLVPLEIPKYLDLA